MPADTNYPDCKQYKRQKPTFTINQEIAEELGKDFRVLPLFEKGSYEYKYTRHYSLHSNEFLKCRWRSYVQHFDERTFAPFIFVNIRDYHFYNCVNRLLPSESVFRRTDYRHKLKVGPGVDYYGQMPIPQEMLMKRGTKTVSGPKKYNKDPENAEKEGANEKALEKK